MSNWYKFEAKDDTLNLEIFDVIGDDLFGESVSAKSVLDQVKDFKGSQIHVSINSPGGSVFDGFAIYNLLKNHSAEVSVTVKGLAASVASVIAMAGDTIQMDKGSFIMIHEASVGTFGNKQDHLKNIEILGKIDNELANVYAERTQSDHSDILEMMAEETWMNSEEAADFGFADSETTERVKAFACDKAVIERYCNAPAALFETSTPQETPMAQDEQTPAVEEPQAEVIEAIETVETEEVIAEDPTASLQETAQKFFAAFGEKSGEYLASGNSFEDCQTSYIASLEEENGKLQAKLEHLQASDASNLSSSGNDEPEKKKGLVESIKITGKK